MKILAVSNPTQSLFLHFVPPESMLRLSNNNTEHELQICLPLLEKTAPQEEDSSSSNYLRRTQRGIKERSFFKKKFPKEHINRMQSGTI